MKQWYVIRTKPFREESVCRLLANAQIDMFLPKVEHYIRAPRAHYYRSGPLFPSYCFCHIDFSSAQNYNLVRYTRGVFKILGCPSPVPIGNDVIAILKQKIHSSDFAKIIPFRRGEQLRVKRGLLKDLIGILKNPIDDNGRVEILLKLVNYEMKAHLHWSELEKIAVGFSALR